MAKKVKIGIANCLNMANAGEKRRAVDSAVLRYYASLKPTGYELVLLAVGSSEKDADACNMYGWQYVEADNSNVGRKRNTGVKALIDQGADVIVRIGSDDVASLALLDEIARRAAIGHEGYWELRGFHFYDVQQNKLVLSRLHQYGFAWRVDRLKGDLYNEDGRIIDAGIDIKGRSWGYPWYHISNPEKYPFIAMKSGEEINSFGTFYEQNHRLLEEADPDNVFTQFFPTLNTDFTSVKANAKPKKNKRNNQV